MRPRLPFFVLGSIFIAAGVIFLVRSIIESRVEKLRAAWKAAGEA